jgi:chemotaxis protein MotB
MQLAARRSRSAFDIWPGFVDALATLLMVIIFLLMIFVVAQFYLNDALLGRDKALESLNRQVTELAELLDLERNSNTDLRKDLAELSAELQSSLGQRDELQTQALLLGEKLEDAQKALEDDRQRLAAQLADANKFIEASKEKIEIQVQKLAQLQQEVLALQALKKDLEKQMGQTKTGQKALVEEKKLSAAAKAQVALLNRQLAALRSQLAKLNEALEASSKKDKEQKAKIADLGKKLNTALARKVQELARYRSEFFGRLRVVLGNRDDIRVVGDRFVFQSEVLFASGSAEIGSEGQKQLTRLARTLNSIASRIPKEINWVLRIDGHTDNVPIATGRFPSNWELSAARAISVVKFLKRQGTPPNRLAAAGFAEHYPLVAGSDEASRRRNRRIEMKLDQR